MKHLKAKLIGCIALACALLVGLDLLYTDVHGVAGRLDNAEEAAVKLEGIGMSVASLLESNGSVAQDYLRQRRNDVDLTALSLRDDVTRDGDAALRTHENGGVVRKGPGGLVLPEDYAAISSFEPLTMTRPPIPLADCAPFEDDAGAFWTSQRDASGDVGVEDDAARALCIYRRIYGAYYYASITPLADIRAYMSDHADLKRSMGRIEENYDCRIVAFEDSGDEKWLIYGSEPFGEAFRNIGDMGIRPDAGTGFGRTTIDGAEYLYAVSKPFAVEGVEAAEGIASFRVVYLKPAAAAQESFGGKRAVLTAMTLIIFAVLIVWAFSIIGLMRREVVSQSQRRRYGPSRTRLIAVSIGVMGFFVVLAGSLFTDILNDVYDRTQGNQSVLKTLHAMQTENNDRTAGAARQREELYTGYAARIAALLAERPELKTAETLAEMNRTIGADYLMLYDDKGRETLSSSRYTLLSYGAGEDSTTYDFRRLISGVPSIVHETCRDEVTGLERQLIGVSMDDGDASDGYASLIVALEPDGTRRLSDGDILRLLTDSRHLILSIDRESGVILQSSDEALVGKNALELGLSSQSLKDGFMDFFRLNGERWYGCSTAFDGKLDYCASRVGSMIGDNLKNGLRNGIVFLAGYILLALAVLWGFTEKNVDKLGGRVVDDASWMTEQDTAADANRQRVRSGALQRLYEYWATVSPERKAWTTLELLLLVGLLLRACGLGGRRPHEKEIISFVLGGQWTPGVNIFALTRIVLMIEDMVLALLIVGLVSGLIGYAMEARGRTITKLLEGLLKYIIVIVALFYAFDVLSFDTRTLLASLGIFSLAVSLAAKDLVSDILSGISLVFSGEYQIGDIVEIEGFEGRVWQIGVRSTTLVNSDGNIKSISNRNISNVTNLSRMNSWYTLQISVRCNQPLDQIEDMLTRELPAIGKGIHEIIHGPVYRGITAVGSGKATLSLAAECSEQDLGAVRSKLNLAILRIFERNNIPIR